ncbi:predicted protein [Naegleria gruberi]|uniref:Predicted protein n=1 Tax=Naegleria gruberi TaxID=5762 RepID=D2VU50_NAEGR|nr:uncharacterized protein NAEGRDRAFT_52264 [Naegleria gruberi]EFC39568.1 predicted protein [Naegleria gruberi]|eukprot:XP_002672312.1 predicted protein [Naegleria gruberi strain NEG-M]
MSQKYPLLLRFLYSPSKLEEKLYFIRSFKLLKLHEQQQQSNKKQQHTPYVLFNDFPTSSTKLFSNSQNLIAKQVENLLFKWKEVDISHETSIETFNHQQSQFQNSEREYSQIEMDAEFFKSRKQSNFELSNQMEANKKIPHPLFEKSSISSLHNEPNEKAKLQVEILQRMEKQRLNILSKKVHDELGWCPMIDNSSDILYMKGHCKKGSVIGFYPGMVYSVAQLKKAEEKFLKITKGDSSIDRYNRSMLQPYLQKSNQPQFYINGNLENEIFFNTMYNHDEIFNDATLSFNNDDEDDGHHKNNRKQAEGAGSNLSKRLSNVLEGEEENFEKYGCYLASRFLHPFSLMNKSFFSNTSRKISANVLAFPFVVPMSLDPSLFAYIPNRVVDDKRSLLSGTGLMQGVVYIADRDLYDEPIIRESFVVE